jgi:hypothetical protein
MQGQYYEKSSNQIITLAMISALFVGAPLTAGAAEYSDMPDGGHWHVYAALKFEASVPTRAQEGRQRRLYRPN